MEASAAMGELYSILLLRLGKIGFGDFLHAAHTGGQEGGPYKSYTAKSLKGEDARNATQ
jgi:hypothetical protein